MDRLTPEEYVSLIGREQADNVLEENTLAAAAFPDNRRNLVLVNNKIRLVEDNLFVKALNDISEFYQGCFHICLYIRKDVTT